MECKIENGDGITIIKLIEDFIEKGSATCYYSNTPEVDGKHIGAIGELKIDGKEVGLELLNRCEEIFREKGISKIVAPMNGNTWKQYRTIKL